jgi:hypothetical protein
MEKFLKKNITELSFVFFALLFSFWLMFSTFSYKDNSMLVASKAWSDFASHIPLIRSFSLGNNFPPEYPIFPGSPIRYHFLFYAIVGLLEKIGLRIDIALNVLSASSFFLLLYAIFKLSKLIFKKIFVAFLAVILFLFNGSLSFIYFFKNHPFSFPDTFYDILNNQIFPAFAPYDKSLISGGFWNLNVFTNQRHFALPLAIFLFIFYFLIKAEKKNKRTSLKLAIFSGAIIGSFSFLHGAVFIMSIAILSCVFILFPKQRLPVAIILIITFLVSLPRMFFLLNIESANIFRFNPGYLVANNFSIANWINYWLLNLGLGFILIPLGFLLSDKTGKKVLICFSSLFIIGNIFQFSPDIATNHKFFNLWIIISNIYISFVLYKLWQKKYYIKLLVLIFIFFLTFSGIIDFFAIKNDVFYPISDYPKNPDVSWIIKNTSKDSVFLNSNYIYNPASIAGRKIFLGWPYFSWSLGYNTNDRDLLSHKLFIGQSIKFECKIFKQNKIKYIIIQNKNDIPVNKEFFDSTFNKVYENNTTTTKIYSVIKKCN